MNSETSKLITAIRIPIVVLVVFIHSTVGNINIQGVQYGEGELYNFIHEFISLGLSGCAVPMFFFISGYLFFVGTEWGVNAYTAKVRKRIRTLLVPYLFWNTLLLAFFWLMQTCLPSLFSGRHKMIADFSGMDFLMAYWDMGEGFPACGPMWFVRNLLILVLISFVIHFLMKEKRVGAGMLILMLVVPKSIAGLFFFSLGAWTAIHQIDFVRLCNNIGKYVVVPYLAVLTWKTVYIVNGGDDANMRTVMSLLAVMGIVVFVWLTSLCIRGRELSPAVRFLSASSFFVYACIRHRY